MIGVAGASKLVMVHMSVTIVILVMSGVIPCLRMKVFGVCIARCGVIPFVRICVRIAVISTSFVGVTVHGCKLLLGKWRMCTILASLARANQLVMCPMRWLIVLSWHPLRF